MNYRVGLITKMMRRILLPVAVMSLLSACANTATPHGWTGMRNGLHENIYTGDDHI